MSNSKIEVIAEALNFIDAAGNDTRIWGYSEARILAEKIKKIVTQDKLKGMVLIDRENIPMLDIVYKLSLQTNGKFAMHNRGFLLGVRWAEEQHGLPHLTNGESTLTQIDWSMPWPALRKSLK